MRSAWRLGALSLLLVALPWAEASPGDAGAPGLGPGAFALGLPDKPWKLIVELPGFEMGPVQQLSGGARALGSAEASGLVVSLTLASSPSDPSPRSCRDHDWAGRQKAQPVGDDIRLTAQGDQARVEYLVPSGTGEQQKHVLVYLQRDGTCAVVHLSKGHYLPSDAAALERVLASVRLGS
jgi:hypothetical protein